MIGGWQAVVRCAALLALLLAGCATDSERPRPEARGQKPGPGADRAGAGWEQYDLNGDGKISRGEFAAVRNVCFARLDANGDSTITREEMGRALRQLPVRRLDEAFSRLDDDGDGGIDRRELERDNDRLFRFADVNGDGVLAGMELDGLGSALSGELCQWLDGRASPGGEKPPEEPGASGPRRRR